MAKKWTSVWVAAVMALLTMSGCGWLGDQPASPPTDQTPVSVVPADAVHITALPPPAPQRSRYSG